MTPDGGVALNEMIVRPGRKPIPRSPLRYPGGKASMTPLFQQIIQEIQPRPITYVEPYAGGAGAGISLLLNDDIQNLVINDFDPAVHAFWYSLVHMNGDFRKLVEETPVDIETWHHQKMVYKRCEVETPLDLGFAFFFLNRTNRSGVLNAGVIGGQAQSGTYKIDARYNKPQLIQRIDDIGSVAHRIYLSDLDGRTVIETYAGDERAFLYIDPPYVEAGTSLYLNAFAGRDHRSLAEVISRIDKANWLVTYDQNEFTTMLYAEHFQCQLALDYSANKRVKARELLVASPSVAEAIRSIQPQS